jgi:hypothetical protein
MSAQTESVAQMAAVIYAARVGTKSPTGNERRTYCDEAAEAAWDLYNAVQITTTDAAKKLTTRHTQHRKGQG